MDQFQEKEEFIRSHAAEIKPILGDEERKIVGRLEEGNELTENSTTNQELSNILERFETHVYLYEKADVSPDAKRFILAASEPLAYQTMMPLLERLKKDPRCSAIGFITDNVSGKRFSDGGDDDFVPIHHHDQPVLVDILRLVKEKPFDVAVACIDPPNAPQSVLLHAAKSTLGAKKLFFIAGGWAGLGAEGGAQAVKSKTREMVDGIFRNDELAKLLIRKDDPSFPEDRIYSIGTPALDSLEFDKIEEYNEHGRKEHGIPEDAYVVFYGGGIQKTFAELYGSCQDIESITLKETAQALAHVAKEAPERKFALILRSHPREDPSARKAIYNLSDVDFPSNVTVVSGHRDDWANVNEINAVADMVVSLVGTDTLFARFRGKDGVFLAYEGKGLGADLLETVYPNGGIDAIRKTPGVILVSSPEDFAEFLKSKITQTKSKTIDRPKVSDPTGAALDAMLKGNE